MFAIIHPGFQSHFVKNTVLQKHREEHESKQEILGHIHAHVITLLKQSPNKAEC